MRTCNIVDHQVYLHAVREIVLRRVEKMRESVRELVRRVLSDPQQLLRVIQSSLLGGQRVRPFLLDVDVVVVKFFRRPKPLFHR